MIIDKTFRRGPLSINYVTNFEVPDDGKDLLIVFPAVNSLPGVCLASYFNYNKNPHYNVVHLIDNFGSYGSYYLKRWRSFDLFEMLVASIQGLIEGAQRQGRRVIFAGTSKGASIALMCAGRFNGVECIAGEPQILLGDFLIGPEKFHSEALAQIAHVILGRSEVSDRSLLNEKIMERILPCLPQWGSRVTCLVGSRTGYHRVHIAPLWREIQKHDRARNNFSLLEFDLDHHNDIANVFIAHLTGLGIIYPASAI